MSYAEGIDMAEVKGILHVYDFLPEELELIYYALRYYCIRGAVEPEQRDLARKIEEAIEVYLQD